MAEVGGVAELTRIATHAPEKKLSEEDVRVKSPKLITAIRELVRLKNPKNEDVFKSKKGVYQWSSFDEHRIYDSGYSKILDLRLTEHTLRKGEGVRKNIMLGPNIIAVTIQDFEKRTNETHVNTVRALNEVKRTMRHLSNNISPTT